jgi:hypothetical protein
MKRFVIKHTKNYSETLVDVKKLNKLKHIFALNMIGLTFFKFAFSMLIPSMFQSLSV